MLDNLFSYISFDLSVLCGEKLFVIISPSTIGCYTVVYRSCRSHVGEIGGRLFMIQPFSTERFEREKNSPKAKRFWETIKLALVP